MGQQKQRRDARIKAAPIAVGLTSTCAAGNHQRCFSHKCACSCHSPFALERQPFALVAALKDLSRVVTRNGLGVSKLKVEFDMLTGYISSPGFGSVPRKMEWFHNGHVFSNRKE